MLQDSEISNKEENYDNQNRKITQTDMRRISLIEIEKEIR